MAAGRAPEGFDAAPENVDRNVDTAPDRPAVFLIWPREGAPYLARTTLLRRRLRRLLGERAAPGRALNLRGVASRVEYWLTGSRLEANLLFYELARTNFPTDYLKRIKLRFPHWVKVTMAEMFPRTQITSRLSGGRSLYYGPFRTRVSAEQFESQALDLFQVRRCQERLAPSPEHPGCIYGEMNLCLRPCQEAVSAEEYRNEAGRLVRFLETEGRSLIEPLEASRDRLSQEMEFEAAARQHKQLEKIGEALRARDELVREAGRLNGIAVTRSAVEGACELWFMLGGVWQPGVHFGFEVVGGKTVSLDHRLRETAAAALPGLTAPAAERQEHVALLARWFYSSWRDGEWFPFERVESIPYRKLVHAVSRAAGPLPA